MCYIKLIGLRCILFKQGGLSLKPKDIIELEITNTAADGRGIGKICDFVIFVNGACEQDFVSAKIFTVHKTYATAGVERIIRSSPFRQTSFCKMSAECGGCPLSHIKYEKQLEIKKQTVIDALRRIGSFNVDDVEISDTVGMKEPFYYRNKMVFPVGISGVKSVGGFYAPKSHDVIPVDVCMSGEKAASAAMQCVIKWMNDKKVSPFDEKKKCGFIRRVFVRTGFNTKEMMVVISSYSEKINDLKELVNLLKNTDFGDYELKSVILNVNRKTNNLVLGKENITLWGNDRITDKLMGFSFFISPHSFFQVNPLQTEVLYNTALNLAKIDNTTTVLDIYCGIGTISLCAAKRAKHVIGVEIVESAINDAKNNAKCNGIENTEFYCGAAEQIVPELIKRGVNLNVVILDPPRKGSDEKTLSAILKAAPKYIVYVSCNPATLARDAKFLADGGYRLKKAVPVDMFPHTAHIETVALLSNENMEIVF